MPRPASLKVRALQWLAQREHSRSELRVKLLHALRGDDDPTAAGAEVDALLDWLESRGFMSRLRFVESRTRVRQARYGNQRIQRELAQHGLALDPAALAALKDSELGRAREVWRKKYGSLAEDASARVRQMRFLAGRGFSAEVVRRVVRGIEGDD